MLTNGGTVGPLIDELLEPLLHRYFVRFGSVPTSFATRTHAALRVSRT